jgi:hypothetical protein
MVYQILKLKESHFYFGKCPTIKLTKIIADTIWIHYAYRRQFMIVKPKNQREVNHENLTSCKNLDRLPRYQFEKKIPSVPTGGSLTNFVLISEKKS